VSAHTLDLWASAALSSCPAPPEGCGQPKGAHCRTEDGRARSRPHPARKVLALAIMRERSRAAFLGSTTWPAARLDAWQAGRSWDREQAEALRAWLASYGPILWSPTPTPGGPGPG
jgi:hypothetical protein